MSKIRTTINTNKNNKKQAVCFGNSDENDTVTNTSETNII